MLKNNGALGVRNFIFRTFIYVIVILYVSNAYSQGTCSTDLLHQKRLTEDPIYKQNHLQLEQLTYQLTIQKNQFNQSGRALRISPSLYKVPVVVHIVHNGGTENIPDAQVLKAISDLNDAFEHVTPYNGVGGIDTKIEFCLATKDPLGNPTSGINRVTSSLTNVDNLTQDPALKDLIRWDPLNYVNIWVVKEICSGADCGTAGYAYLASAHGTSSDGIVCEARYFGSSKDNSKVHIHEMGHYLNLYHTFEKGCPNADCLSDGDKVCDTPPDNKSTASTACASENSCSTDANDLTSKNPFTSDVNDMIENYMDYSGQACQNLFTDGQRVRMVTALSSTRASLLSSPGCTSPCTTSFTSLFNVSITEIEVGETLTFTNLSTGPITSYEWFLDGVSASTSSGIFTHTFSSEGIVAVKLKTSISDPSCPSKEHVQSINVVCTAKADFVSSATEVNIGATVNFTNKTPVTGLSYKWHVRGIPLGVTKDFNYTFTTAGTYPVMLQASNTACSKTKTLTINVTNFGGECTNMDFETGTTSYWNTAYGKASTTGALTAIASGTVPGSHTILTSGYDPHVGGIILPVVYPSGIYSLRLGDTEAGGNGAIIQQRFLVTPTNSNFTYSYAVVLENPGHEHLANPFFNVSLKDEAGKDIACAAYSVIAEPPFAGFTVVPDKEIYYKGWTTVTVPLAAYIGQNVSITFTVSDCAYEGHFGYAYIDGSCFPLTIKGPKAVCTGETVKLVGPEGFSSYSWTGPGIIGASNISTITVNKPGTYNLAVNSAAGATCGSNLSITLTGTVTSIDAGPDKTICKGNSIKLNAIGGSNYKWTPTTGLSDPNIPNPIAKPTTTTTYTVTSCGASDQVKITIVPAFNLDVTSDMTLCGNTVTVPLTATASPASFYEYTWSPDSASSDPHSPTTIVTTSTTRKYYVTVKDQNSACVVNDSVLVTVNPGFSLSPLSSPTILCHNSPVTSVTLTANPSGAGSSIEWYEGTSLVGTGNTITKSPTVTTTYTVKGKLADCKVSTNLTVPYYTVDAGPDKTICESPVTLDGSDNADLDKCKYILTTIPYVFDFPDKTWTSVKINKDNVSNPIDIGFDFFFYCKNYSKFYIGSNGYILFDNKNGGSPFMQRIPDVDVPNNLIALAWSDLQCMQSMFPSAMNCYSYKLVGTAPSRILKVYFGLNNATSTSPENKVLGYINLFESTGIIELHLVRQMSQYGYFTMGIENSDGTKAMPVPGKNRQYWTDYNIAYRFTPSEYIVYDWTPDPLSGDNTLTPIVQPSTTTTYTVTADNGVCKSSDQVKVTVNCISLPVDHLELNVRFDNNQSYLNWSTELVKDNNTFYIERSFDGVHWTRLDTITHSTRSGSGYYSFQYIDQTPGIGFNCYRII